MKVLLSIKPEFASKIFIGVKKYEFRRTIFKRDVKKVIVYASSPVKKVIGEFEVGEILFHDIKTLWSKTKKCSGIEKKYFYKYFKDKKNGYAIEIKNYKEYKIPLPLEKDFGIKPPQSYVYIK
jgi:predicted transcriptional regulator